MTLTLSSDTQKLIEQQMATGRFATADDLVRAALQTLAGSADYENIDAETAAAIDEAEVQYERGEGRPWEDVRAELRIRFIKQPSRRAMPDGYQIIILPRASADLVEICAYIEEDSPQNASVVARRLIDAVDSLSEMPHRYEVHEHRKDPAKAVRSMAVPPFIVYYRIDEAHRAIRILCIRHGARRQPPRFR